MRLRSTDILLLILFSFLMLFAAEPLHKTAQAQNTTIYADEDTYSARAYFTNFGTGWQFNGIFPFEITDNISDRVDASIRSSSADISYWRTIIQYNLGGIDEPVEEAILRLHMTEARSVNPIGEPDFDVDIYGSTQNRGSSLPYDDFSAGDEWDNSVGFNTGYSIIEAGFVTANDDAGETYTVDVTDFINDRIADAQNSGDTWVFFRVQGDYFDNQNAFFDDINTNYKFATPYNSSEFRPALELSTGSAGSELEIADTEGFRLLSSPVQDASTGQLLSDIWTQGFPGADTELGNSNVLVWNEGNGDPEARGFAPVSSASDAPQPAEGFAVFVYEDDNPFEDGVVGGFPKTLSVDGDPHTGTITAPVSLTPSESGYNETDDGWNLVGNPYNTTIDWDAGSGWTRDGLDDTMYIYDPETQDYLSWNGSSGTLDDGTIEAWQGFWVKANNTSTPALSMTEDVQSTTSARYETPETGTLALELTQGDQSSQSMMVFHPDATPGKDDISAYQLQSLSSEYLTLFTQYEDEPAMDIQSVPSELTKTKEYTLGIHASDPKGGMRLSWTESQLPDDLTVELIDHKNGTVIDMKQHQEYRFNHGDAGKNEAADSTQTPLQVIDAEKAKEAGSLSIRLTPGVATGTEPDETPQQITLEQNYPNPFNPETVITFNLPEREHVQLKVFDMTGQEITTLQSGEMAAGTHQAVFDASQLASGVYLYKLEAGSFSETRKMLLVK